MAADALSPSRAGDFVSCPLLFRYRTIDRLPESSSPDAVRGTLVHQVLEDIFDLPAAERTPARAHTLVEPAWATLREGSRQAREVAATFDEPAWLDSAHEVLERWFTLEDPTRLEPAEREAWVEARLDSGLTLRGIIDRLDEAPDGSLRVVDYKGLAVDTPLPTPSGWTTMGEVEVGDHLLGTDGRPTTVTKKSGVHHRPCYRVSFRDGAAVTCDNVHLWTVVHSYRQTLTRQTLDTDGLANLHSDLKLKGTPNSLWVESAEALQIDADVHLPVDPWLLGAWLGDGSTQSGQLTIGRDDLADMLTLIKERWPRKVIVREARTAYAISLSKLDDRCTYGHSDWLPSTLRHPTRRCAREVEHVGMAASNVAFSTLLQSCGVRRNKHVPSAYLRASSSQRLDLLRGLMDTDGWRNELRHRAGFTTTDDRLAADMVELLHTLGQRPYHFQKPHTNAARPDRTRHVIEFTPVGLNPFSLPRKAGRADRDVTRLQKTLARRRVISSVERVDSVPTQCVEVDAANALYLCGRGFVPTHNTGRPPGEGFEARALFQLRIYALIIWRTRRVVPAMLQLVYLGGDGQVIRYEPDEFDLVATERKVDAIWAAIQEARATGEFLPSRGKQCDWCAFKAHCPEFGGTVLPMPAPPTRWDLWKRKVRSRWRRVSRRDGAREGRPR